MDAKLEVVVIPVSDVDRGKRFYEDLGWRMDIDLAVSESVRVVQFTPPGSPCSIHIGEGITSAAPGSAKNMYLVVEDIEGYRAELADRGVDVSESYHRENGEVVSGRDPDRTSYGTYASFSDPDGNTWLVQEITERLPGRV